MIAQIIWPSTNSIWATCFTLFVWSIAQCSSSPALAQQGKEFAAPGHASNMIFNFFISGHSLTDNPLPDYIAAVFSSKGFQVNWNRQSIVGSPIAARTRGDGRLPQPWNGYRSGNNKRGSNLDIVAELREKRGLAGYTALIVAEGHNTIKVLRYADTVRFLRHFHELLIEGNPSGTTYLYEPWETIKDISNPRPWIALERDATKIWGCVAHRINLSLEHEKRPDRIKSLPIAAGLAELIDKVTTEDINGISASATEQTMKRIFIDDVHLTHFGLYYVALLNYAGIIGDSPQGAWRPDFVTADQAATLQGIAWSFYQNRGRSYRPHSIPECLNLLRVSFCDEWNSYVPSKWAPFINDCKTHFAKQTVDLARRDEQSPFFFDPATDAGYWHPAP